MCIFHIIQVQIVYKLPDFAFQTTKLVLFIIVVSYYAQYKEILQ